MAEAVGMSTEACSILVQDKDLRKLEELDPSQSDGYRSFYKTMVACTIRLMDDEDEDIVDRQEIVINILEKKKHGELTNLRVEISSEIDLYFNFLYNCNSTQFQGVKSKNDFNIRFKDFATALVKMIEGCKDTSKDRNNLEFTLSRDNTNTLRITQNTEYKVLELITLVFSQSELDRVNQSIVYRYNYQKAKLTMIDSTLESVYAILDKKNPSLLQYIKKNVGYI